MKMKTKQRGSYYPKQIIQE